MIRLLIWLLLWLPIAGLAGHRMDLDSMVMNENPTRLPQGCTQISGDVKITVHAGRKYAQKFPGIVFAYDRQSWEVPPCARLTVRFINEDHIRHQFMVHGLPEDLYPMGMFTIEVSGPGEESASFILPPYKKTYLVHCDIAQHTEHGMKAQIKVAGGDGDLASLPGLTKPVRPDRYPTEWTAGSIVLLVLALAGGIALVWGGRWLLRAMTED
ncbi:MAG TPA: copper oxidase [Methylothermaceae bacterium]|nr:copper oxidase [Methylothermaceae bacterium]